jgi:Cys-tRNA(Pro) deacylase
LNDTPAVRAVATAGVPHRVVTYGRVAGAVEAAAARGVELHRLVKTVVVRRGDSDYVLVLVPGDRVIDWPALRSHLGVARLSLPSAEEALEATGYVRGAITPFGALGDWPVVADEAMVGLDEVSIGGGMHGVAIHLSAADLLEVTGASTGRVTRLQE